MPFSSPFFCMVRQSNQEPAGATRIVRAVVFDLDNTLIDFLGMKRQASEAAARAMVGMGADFVFTATEAGDILFGEYMQDIEGDLVFERFLKKHHQQRISLNQHQIDKITAAAVNAYLKAKMLQLSPYPGVPQTLMKLVRRGIRMGVVTDAPRFKAYQRLVESGLVHYFDFVVTHTDHGEMKPDPRPFREALNILDLPPHEVLMVGDWPERDIMGAAAVGMKTAWAKWGRPTAPVPACDHVLAHMAELQELL